MHDLLCLRMAFWFAAGCNKEVDPREYVCENCHSADKEPEILVGVNFADGLGPFDYGVWVATIGRLSSE